MTVHASKQIMTTPCELSQCRRPCCKISGECCGCCGEALQRPRWHKSLTYDALAAAVLKRRQSTPVHLGYCMVCGLEHDNIAPASKRHECDACGTATVYSAGELLIRLVITRR